MMFTPQFQRLLRDQIREQPLADGELRNLAWAGEMYICEPPAPAEAGYVELATLTIDAVRYKLIRKIN